MYIFRLLVVGVLVTSHSRGENHDHCKTNQYLQTGKRGVIVCHFQEGFYAVAWYTPESYVQKKPLLRLVNGAKIEGDIATGEFDVRQDGSLIINNVSLNHDVTFTAVKFQSQGEEPKNLNVRVTVLVKPSTTFPVADVCKDGNASCYTRLNPRSMITCYVTDSRPAIPLKWLSRTFGRELNISFQYSAVEDGSLFASRATTSDAFAHSSSLSLIVCKADNEKAMLSLDESVIFVENESSGGLGSEKPIMTYIERDDSLMLPCSSKNVSLIVWKKADLGSDDFHILMYAALFDGSVSRTYTKDYELQHDGSLTLSPIQSSQEGRYGCIFETFTGAGGVALYDVTVIVPAIPVIEGCSEQQYCVLNVESEETLRCSVTGIRPRVGLEWVTGDIKDSRLIEFSDHQLNSISQGDLYDVVLISRFRIKPTLRDRLALECRITGTNITTIRQKAHLDLRINTESTTVDNEGAIKHQLSWLLVLIIPLGLILAALFLYFCICKGRQRTKYGGDFKYQEERIPMFRSRKNIANKNQFIAELKTKYQDLYDAVQPIPYIRDRLFCVDKVFVEGGIEYLIANDRIEGRDTWNKLLTYHDICNDSRIKSSRRIIEGEPGYGKSTLSLQLAYDWCNRISGSSMKNTDIFILLQLRQLGGVPSIYKAIKQFLLPKDSKLSESDITDILSECFSVVIMLDGFDEYPDQDSGEKSDVINIIGRKMFQQFDVILTTRSSCLPEEYSAITKRIRLTGFDENARDLYIQKAVVGDDVSAAARIKRKLKENPILGDLCQVPLLFVMFAHMSHENESFHNFSSVTSFFRYMISCFHSHLKNKTKYENVKIEEYHLLEEDHKELDELAFEGLSGKKQRIVWKKEYICKRLGRKFYEHYVRLGILVEGEVLDIDNDENAMISEHIQYKTEVRFYHKLFCEWYAAHHLSHYASSDDASLNRSDILSARDLSITNKTLHKEDPGYDHKSDASKEGDTLKYLDPLDVQYLYRFACGLNRKAAEKITEYFKSKDDASRFVILCMLEQGSTGVEALRHVSDLCSKDVYIYRDDSMLLQRSTIQLLEIASVNEINISRLWLADCFSTVDSGTGSIQLTSDICVPILNTLKELVIEERGREMTEEEIACILKYPLMSAKLQELRFYDCLLPQTIKGESLSLLRSKEIQVFWRPDFQYILNVTSGTWEDEDDLEPVTPENYEKEAEKVRSYRKEEVTKEL